MDTNEILRTIDQEIERLKHAKALITGEPVKSRRGRPATKVAETASAPKKRIMSAAGRARIAAAQKARWAKSKKAA
jgi:hypothetical protein